ncbi:MULTISPECIES: NlpC/P60 family protein [Bacillota]|uniref:NlpC/P60 family protein n=1 Tax=Bacillota TaxID=1239 RepID=UPI0039EE8CCE
MSKVVKMSIAFAVGFSGLSGLTANAESNDIPKRIDSQIENLQLQIHKMDKEINIIQNEKSLLQNQIDRLQSAIVANEKKVKEADVQFRNLEKEISLIESEIDRMRIDMGVAPVPKNKTTYFSLDLVQNKIAKQTPTLSNEEFLLINAENLASLLRKQTELQEKIKQYEKVEVELLGMTSLINEQFVEKTSLLEELDKKEMQTLSQKENLQQENKMLTKQKSAIEKAIENENARKEGRLVFSDYTPSLAAEHGSIKVDNGKVPQEYMKYYLYGEQAYGVPWYYLAAIHKIETSFSTHPTMVSSVGAVGAMQFMPSTWVGYRYETSGGLVSPGVDITDLEMINKGGGYGVDADNDGIASPWSIADSVAAAAKYLSSNGFSKNKEKAIWHYNHADWYVRKVIAQAELYKNSNKITADGKVGFTASTESKLITVGKRWIGNSVYVFGGGRNQDDIAQGKFDCSSFVYWAFSQTGINLGELTSVSTETLKNVGKPVNVDEIQPGDLVFFDTYKKDGHVGIYIGEGKFIGAQSSTGVAIADMSQGYWKEKFNNRVNRVNRVIQ